MNKLIKAFSLAFLASAAAAAGAPAAPLVFAKLKPAVGAWAEYSVETKQGGAVKSKGTFRMAIVGKDAAGLWIEQKTTPEIPKPKTAGGATVMKFLKGKNGISKAYMKTSRGVMDMSAAMASSARKQQAAVDAAKMAAAGTETIEVPAGKFKTTHYTMTNGNNSGDVWMKAGVGPYGMVKQVYTAGDRVTTLTLLDSGGDAKSEVDETTARSFGPGMMGRPSKPDRGAESGGAGAKAPVTLGAAAVAPSAVSVSARNNTKMNSKQKWDIIRSNLNKLVELMITVPKGKSVAVFTDPTGQNLSFTKPSGDANIKLCAVTAPDLAGSYGLSQHGDLFIWDQGDNEKIPKAQLATFLTRYINDLIKDGTAEWGREFKVDDE